jgi:hypothetical protein
MALVAGCPGGDDTPAADAGPPDADPPDAEPLGGGVGTLAGGARAGTLDGARNVARFDNPVNVLVGPDGMIYVADFDNNRLRRATPEGTVTTIVAQADFARPFGMVFDASGTLWVQTDRNSSLADTGGLWTVDLATGQATIVEENFGRPRGMAMLSDGRIAMARYGEAVVDIYDPTTGTRAPLAGKTNTFGYMDGTGEAARFDMPYDVVVEPGDVLVVTDYKNNRLRQITLAGVVTTRAGTGMGVSMDGTLAMAGFHNPQGLARSSDGALWVSEAGGHVIRRVEGGMVTTVAGDGTPGFQDNLTPLSARFFGLEGLDVVPDATYLYIADGDRGEEQPYNRVRRMDLSGL